jgi:hypothetical protein
VLAFLNAGGVRASAEEVVDVDDIGRVFEESMHKLQSDPRGGPQMFTTFFHPEFNLNASLNESDRGRGRLNDMRQRQYHLMQLRSHLRRFDGVIQNYSELQASQESKRLEDLASVLELVCETERAAEQAFLGNGPARTLSRCDTLFDGIQAVSESLRQISNLRSDRAEYEHLMSQLQEWYEDLLPANTKLLSIYEDAARLGEAIIAKDTWNSSTIAPTPPQRASIDSVEPSVDMFSRSGMYPSGPGCIENANKSIVFAGPFVPRQLEREYILSRLDTVYNVLHAEHNWLLHDLQIDELRLMLRRWSEFEVKRLETMLDLWKSCSEKLSGSVENGS